MTPTIFLRWVDRSRPGLDRATDKVLQQGFETTGGANGWLEWIDVPTTATTQAPSTAAKPASQSSADANGSSMLKEIVHGLVERRCGVRIVVYTEYIDDFGDTVIRVNPHFNDIQTFGGGSTYLLDMLKRTLGMRVAWNGQQNHFLIKKWGHQ